MKLKFKIDLTTSQKQAYEAAHNNNIKYLTLVWSRQSGKSTLMKVLVIEWLFSKNVKIAYVCRNYILAKQIFKDLLIYIPKEFIKSANGSELAIESIYGTTLKFFSAESGDSLRGLTFHYLICDEFAFFRDLESFWNDILFPTVKVHGKRIIFVSTPRGKNNTFYNMYLRGLDPKYPKYHSIKKTIYDDGLVTPDEIDSIKSQIPDMSFQQEFMVEFLDSAVTFFTGFEKCFTDYEFDESSPCAIGIDLSSVGTDETVLTKVNSKKQTIQYIVKGTLDKKYAQLADIINFTPNLRSVYIESNGIGAPMINEITKLVKNKNIITPWHTSNDSKVGILSQLAVAIAKNDIWFNNDNTSLYTQLANFIYKYTKHGNLQLEGKQGTHDDMVMSLAIAHEALLASNKVGEYTLRFNKK